MKYLLIEYNNRFTLRYRLRDNAFVPRWVDCVVEAQKHYTIDDPTRFYGFGSIEQQRNESVKWINQCVDVVNDYMPIIDRKLTSVDDQDTLNYLHSIFEQYHGMLETQTHYFWHQAPDQVKTALADLNVLVHRCESVSRGAQPRHVVTYYGLPKTNTLSKEDYDLFEPKAKFGTVYLNYVEIGKTLEHLAIDNDKYISDEAFKPWHYYSADFNVKFWQDDDLIINELDVKIKQYYHNNQEFFEGRGYKWGDYKLVGGQLPLADLEDAPEDLLEQLERNQQVSKVTFE